MLLLLSAFQRWLSTLVQRWLHALGLARGSPLDGTEGDYWSIFEATRDGLVINRIESGLVVQANSAAAALHGYTRQAFIGLHPTFFMHPDSPLLFSDYIRAARAEGQFEACALHLRRDGSSFYAEVRGTAFTYQEQPCLLSIIRDVSDQVWAELRLQAQMEARLHEQATLLEFSQTLASDLAFKPGLILDQIRALIKYTHGAIFVLDDLTLVALAVRGPQPLLESMPLRLWLDDHQCLVWLSKGHLSGSTEPGAQFFQSLLAEQAAALADTQAWMWLPLAAQGQVIGGIIIAHTQAHALTAHQVALAQTMANQASITMVNARLYEQAQALAVLEERQRLAHTLHDAVNQSLFSAGLIAEVLPRLWEQDPAEARQSLEDLRRLTIGAAAEMRGLLAELRPLALIDADMDDLLYQLANALTGRTNIPVFVTVEGHASLPAEVQVAFYR